MGGYDSPHLVDAFLTNRDGIVGPWIPPADNPTPALDATDPNNVMELWEPGVRAHVLDSELLSRLGFHSTSADDIVIEHLNITSGNPPSYVPLMTLHRPTVPIFKLQLDLVNNYADLRADRAHEILAQIDTPIAFLGSIAFLRPERTRWTFELLDAVYRLAKFVEMRAKHALACRRPIEFSPQVQPMILTPGHGTLPSGHGTEAFAMATTLLGLLQAAAADTVTAGGTSVYDDESYATQLMRQASRITINRTIAGVHFPADNMAGAILGIGLGQYVVARARPGASGVDNTYQCARFLGGSVAGDADFFWNDLVAANPNVGAGIMIDTAAYIDSLTPMTIAASQDTALNWLWTKAIGEWT